MPRAKARLSKTVLVEVVIELRKQWGRPGSSTRQIAEPIDRGYETVQAHLEFAQRLGWVDRLPSRAARWRLAWKFMLYERDRVGLDAAARQAVADANTLTPAAAAREPLYTSHFKIMLSDWDPVDHLFVGRLKALEKIRPYREAHDPRLRRWMRALEEAIVEAATLRFAIGELERSNPAAFEELSDSECQFHEVVRITKRQFDQRHKWPMKRYGKIVNW